MKSLRILAVALFAIALLAGGFACKSEEKVSTAKEGDKAAKAETPAVGEATNKAEATKDEATKAEAPKAEVAKVETTKPAVAGSASTPDAVIKQAIVAFKNKDAKGAFELLPASFRTELQEVVDTVTSNLDREVFELGVDVFETAVRGLDKHSAMLAGMYSSMAQGAPVTFDEIKSGVTETHSMFKQAGLLDFDKVSKLKVAEFVGTNGSKLLNEGLATAQKLKATEYAAFMTALDLVAVKLVESGADKAKVEVNFGDDKETVDFLKRADGWVPAEWDAGVKEAKIEAAKSMKEFAAQKDETKVMLQAILVQLKKFEETGDIGALMQLGNTMK